ncbi:hypothetical protein LguiB_009073 [Lonicera macranthoides]
MEVAGVNGAAGMKKNEERENELGRRWPPISNIEASSEGFNMLRRVYENVQEPFLNATTMGRENRNDAASNPFAALLGSGGLGRDQSTNPIITM